MTAITHAISLALLHFIWQGPLIAAALWIALEALPRCSPRIRYVVSCGAFAAMTLLPFVTALLVYRAPAPLTSAASAFQNAGSSVSLPVSTTDSWLVWLATIEAWALPVWCAGVLICAIRFIWSARQVAWLRREGDPADPALIEVVTRLARRMELKRPIEVLLSRLADSPCVVGWLRPVILIPAASLLNLTAEQLEAVLAHELAHIRRHDYLINLLQTLAQTLFFYQPAVWWVSARIRRERELCCDDIAVEVCGDSVLYARALTNLERLRMAQPRLAMSAVSGSLAYRVRRLAGVIEEQPPSKAAAILAVLLAMACFLTDVRWARAQQQPASATAVVSKDAIWVDTVKEGDLPIMVRALGTITAASAAELQVPAQQAKELQVGQSVSLDMRGSKLMAATLVRIFDSAPSDGTIKVGLNLQIAVPDFVGQKVDGIIVIRTLRKVVFVGRPVTGKDSENLLFKLSPDGSSAERVKVRFGAFSVNTAQILEGLQPGDKVILSDTSKFDAFARIQLQ